MLLLLFSPLSGYPNHVFLLYAVSFWSDRKYSIGTWKYLARRLRLSKLGSDLPDFQFENAVWLIPVSFAT
nr:MAG TPA: hypothetical protein [Caudoviricetes sp.]